MGGGGGEQRRHRGEQRRAAPPRHVLIPAADEDEREMVISPHDSLCCARLAVEFVLCGKRCIQPCSSSYHASVSPVSPKLLQMTSRSC